MISKSKPSLERINCPHDYHCAAYYSQRTEIMAYIICMLMSAVIGFAAGVASCS